MKIISIDVETCGLNLETNSLLEFSAIIEDTNNLKPVEELPSFTCIVHNESDLIGSPFALNMNKVIIEKLAGQDRLNTEDLKDYRKKHSIIKYDDVATNFYNFLQVSGYTNNSNELQGLSKMVTKWEDLEGKEHFVEFFNNKSNKIHINVLGKNFATFDKIFIEKLPRWKQYFKIRHRIADPSILLTNWKEDDTLPNFKTCMERSNIKGEVSHTAYDDAKDTITMLRKATKNYTLNNF